MMEYSDEDLIPLREAIAILGYSKDSIKRWEKEPEKAPIPGKAVPCIRINGRRRYRRSEVIAYREEMARRSESGL